MIDALETILPDQIFSRAVSALSFKAIQSRPWTYLEQMVSRGFVFESPVIVE